MTTNYRKYEPGTLVRMHIFVPAELREECISAAAELQLPLQQFCVAALREFARNTIGLPSPPPAAAPIPTTADVLRAYVSGEDKLIGPCGARWPCEYSSTEPEILGDWEFCGSCGIRTR